MSQADRATSEAEPPDGGSWWRTMPGMLTAAAGLVSAITGLVVAVEQLRPAHSGAAPTVAAAIVPSGGSSSPADTTPAPTRAAPLRVTFPGGRTVTANHGLRYDLVSADTIASNPDRLALAVHVKITNPGEYDANFWNRTFRLRIGADTSAPTNVLNDIAPGGTTKVGEVDFDIPAATRSATLLVGDDYPHAVAVPLTLRPAR